jgi:hypothetical protein
MSDQMKGAIQRPLELDSRYIKDRDHHSLMRDRPKFKQNSELCSETGVDLVVIGFVEGAEFDDMIGFLPTRNTFFSAFHCASGKGAAKRYEVAQTLGDSFPFQQSLARVFRSFSQKELSGVADL